MGWSIGVEVEVGVVVFRSRRCRVDYRRYEDSMGMMMMMNKMMNKDGRSKPDRGVYGRNNMGGSPTPTLSPDSSLSSLSSSFHPHSTSYPSPPTASDPLRKGWCRRRGGGGGGGRGREI